MNVLVVSSCTARKKFIHENQINETDFADLSLLKSKERLLKGFGVPAIDMYEGDHHIRIKEGLEILGKKYNEKLSIELCIISAGYGIINSNTIIYPYNVTFSGKNKEAIKSRSLEMNIGRSFTQLLKKRDLVVVLLGEDYLTSLNLKEIALSDYRTRFLFFANKSSKNLIPSGDNIYVLETGNALAKKYSTKGIELKGFLFKMLCILIEKQGPQILDLLTQKPDSITELLDDAFRIDEQETQRINSQKIIKWKPKNNKILYYVPQWEDRVDPGYDFITETHTKGRVPYRDDVYAHELLAEPPYDGVLVSKGVIEENRKLNTLMSKLGAHNYFRLPSDFPIIGDCGAFTYVNEEKPKSTTEEVIDFYVNMGLNYGVSLDHLIFPSINKVDENGKPYQYVLTEEDRKYRWQLTIGNAREFIRIHNQKGCNFTPIGAVQGWNLESYREGVRQLVEMGYDYIAVGGMVRSTSKEILSVLSEIKKELRKGMRLHLFGIARLEIVQDLLELGVTSVDSASYLRKAWLSATSNYYDLNNVPYAAIRVPMLNSKNSLKKLENISMDSLLKMEKRSIELLRSYEKEEASLDDTVKAVLDFERVFGKESGLEKHYRRTLKEKPWKKCNCRICQELGIEIIIFRGNNRNRRRGFHNLNSFYHNFQLELLRNDKSRNSSNEQLLFGFMQI
ncbi:MAG: tRNA-guanine transglycosylase DpdA [Candidatus Xenobiia bacterium LiM19]